MEQRILALYKAPFKFDGFFYIFDSKKEMVAWFAPLGDNKGCFEPRGWGRIQYMKDAETLYDATEKYLLDLIGADNKSPTRAVEVLNKHWKNSKKCTP